MNDLITNLFSIFPNYGHLDFFSASIRYLSIGFIFVLWGALILLTFSYVTTENDSEKKQLSTKISIAVIASIINFMVLLIPLYNFIAILLQFLSFYVLGFKENNKRIKNSIEKRREI